MENFRRRTLQASISLEAALVLPVFIFCILNIASLTLLYRAEGLIQETLYESSMAAAQNAYYEEALANTSLLADNGLFANNGLLKGIEALVSSVSSKSILERKADSSFLDSSGIVNGGSGISFITDSFSRENYVTCRGIYSYSLPFNFFGLRNELISQSSSSRKWTGFDPNDAVEDQEETVYITPNGEAYHRSSSCSYINLSIRSVNGDAIENERNLSGGRYVMCQRCCKKGYSGEVYVTDYGSCYHCSQQCSGLKRSPQAVKISEAGGRHACSKCGGNK